MDIDKREKLIAAFEHMVESVGEAIHEAEEALAPTVDEMVHNAEILARDLYALTQEEAESLGKTLKRDIDKANEVLNQQSRELKDWWNFDVELVEDRFADMIARAADKTWLQFRAIESGAHPKNRYHSGEVCNPGTFACRACDSRFELVAIGQLESCKSCGGDEFERIVA
jgi:rRNA maturation endonuclease Nob1